MKKSYWFLILAVGWLGVSEASWYWPFGSEDDEKAASEEPSDASKQQRKASEEDKEPPRLSELMEPASTLIDEASDLAAEGKTQEAIEKYREALVKLNEIEHEDPERAEKPEFATLRNKRAYISAAIDSLQLAQIRDNARAVAVSDTTELEKRLEAERAAKVGTKAKLAVKAKPEAKDGDKEPQVKVKPVVKKVRALPENPRERAMALINAADFEAADKVIAAMLEKKPNGAAALNLKAVSEIRQEKLKEAEQTLDQAIMSNPRSHFAYYNMAWLMLKNDNPAAAKRYYETGRAMGGPLDRELEAQFQ